jgi:hypothetical protein
MGAERAAIAKRDRTLRALALACAALGIVGMIVTSIQGSTGGALSFGLLCASAALVLLVHGAVRPPRGEVDRLRAAAIEEEVAALVEEGVDESRLRRLLRLARGLEL